MKTINFADLKKRLRTQIDNVYLLTGRDLFLLDYSVKLITDACNLVMPELNYIRFIEGDIDSGNVVKALETMPIMCERKVVYVNVSTKIDSLKDEKKLLDYIENASNSSVLIVSAGENKVLTSAKNVVVVDCNKLSEDFVLTYIAVEFKKNGKIISKPCAKKLNEYCMSDMMQITTEISKLSSFVGDREEIVEEDLDKVVNKNVEYQIFELSEALAKRDAKKAYSILDKFKEKKNVSSSLMPLIYSHFRRLFFVAISNMDRKELSAELGVKEYAVSKYAEQARNFKKINLKEIVEICSDMEFGIKNGTQDKENALDFIILKILNM